MAVCCVSAAPLCVSLSGEGGVGGGGGGRLEQRVVSLCPLGFLLFIFKFSEFFYVLHVDE